MTSRPPWEGLDIRQDHPLKPYTTFKIGGPARYFVDIRSQRDLVGAIAFARSHNLPMFVLGGGSNVLISDRGFDGLVVHPVNQGIRAVAEDATTVTLLMNAAATWDGAVAYTVEKGWWGIENLSHIPGQTGAALVQNIGAYGQQISDVFESAEVMDLESSEVRTLGVEDCQFAYRKSVFNTTAKGRFLIFNLTLKLAKSCQPNLQYADVKAHFESEHIAQPTQHEIRRAIIAIRDRKFPFPREEKGGNVGSFFKNLVLSAAEYDRLETRIRQNFGANDLSRLRDYKIRLTTKDGIKIPTAFLMEICGLKSCRVGGVKVNETQPLVLLNLGGATAKDVLTLVRHIRRTIHEKTGVTVSIEPELVGFTATELEHYLAQE